MISSEAFSMNTKFDERRARALTFMLSLGMLAGVLIWAKLRLVTDIPRSALAEPREVDQGSGDPIDLDAEKHEEHDGLDDSGDALDSGIVDHEN
tara:strand:- start:1178 stop:1459 length:282 start_codon:yes stop_codon:yes gene_type:complete